MGVRKEPYKKPPQPVQAPYGAWDSPLNASLVSGASKRFGGMAAGLDNRLVWLEGRPSEGGRGVLMMEGAEGCQAVELTPPHMSVKSKVHEYGGGAFGVHKDVLVFVNQSDQRVYKQSLAAPIGTPPVPLTPEYKEGKIPVRYADFAIDTQRDLLFCVREDHRHGGSVESHSDHEPVNDLVAIPLSPSDPLQEPRVVASGADFYAFPRVSPGGREIVWVEWRHPNMPWDRTSLWVGTLSPSGEVEEKRCVAGGEEALVEAPTEPMWSPQGDLFFVSDRGTGFWNIHRDTPSGVERVVSMDAEFSGPFWVFGNRSFVFHPLHPHLITASYEQGGSSHLAVIDTQTNTLTRVNCDLTSISHLESGTQRLFVAGGSPSQPHSLHEVDLSADNTTCSLSQIWESLTLPSQDPPLPSYFSTPSWVSFPSPSVSNGGLAHAVFYPPHNPDFLPSHPSTPPPLLVRSHGGPTGATDTMLRLQIQYWTSRGWAVADVNYSGSTGYGRAYRERLYKQWGVADVEDARACVEHLAKGGKIDAGRVVTDGSSAGGFTCLAALTFTSAFKAGCSLYGISDLEALAATTHKFEKYYNDKLIGPLPEAEAVYKERSPIHHIDRLNCPVILFQGLEDKVVPPAQARLMYEAVKAKGLPVALVEYPGEDHGFRKGENIEQTLEQESLFFARVLLNIWSLPGVDRELVIENLAPP